MTLTGEIVKMKNYLTELDYEGKELFSKSK